MGVRAADEPSIIPTVPASSASMSPQPADRLTTHLSAGTHERDILLTLFDLGRKVASVIDLDELLPRIPELIGRLIPFDAFAIYFVSEKRGDSRLGDAVGYPDETAGYRLAAGEGLVGRVVATQQPQVVGDVTTDPHYIS